jgi:hypothetical protein
MVSRTSTAANKPLTTNVSGTSTSTGVKATNTSSSSSATGSSRETKVADYLDPVAREALNKLLGNLQDPKSDANKYGQERLNEISKNQSLRADYTKSAAFADAIGAMNSQLAKGIESQMPTITAGIDAAGTSGSAMSALLTQTAAENAARNAAELGLNAAISYGQIQTGFGNVLEQLTAQGDPVTNQLLSALEIAKGASESSTTSGSSSQSQSGTSNSIETSTGTTTDNKKVTEEETPTKKTTSYAFQKFPDMSTPGYSGMKTAVAGSGAGTSSKSTIKSGY